MYNNVSEPAPPPFFGKIFLCVLIVTLPQVSVDLKSVPQYSANVFVTMNKKTIITLMFSGALYI